VRKRTGEAKLSDTSPVVKEQGSLAVTLCYCTGNDRSRDRHGALLLSSHVLPAACWSLFLKGRHAVHCSIRVDEICTAAEESWLLPKIGVLLALGRGKDALCLALPAPPR
jgi:hypothetical protein